MQPARLIPLPYVEQSAHYVEKVLHLPGCLFLDSGHPYSDRGRFDIITARPLYTLRYSAGKLTRDGSTHDISGPRLTHYLGQLLREHQARNPQDQDYIEARTRQELPFCGGLAGYFSYDLGRSWQKLPSIARKDINIPELVLGFYPWAIIADHKLKKCWLSLLPERSPDLEVELLGLLDNPGINNNIKFNLNNKLECDIKVDYYKKSIGRIQDYILAGDCYQVNFAQRHSAGFSGHPWPAYLKLRESMAAPFGTFLKFNNGFLNEDSYILSFSPERFIQITGTNVLTQPIKGTSPRSRDAVQDLLNADRLASSEKNRAENLMIVDLLRNDLGKCCVPGSVRTEKLFELQSFKNVHHLVSSVTGKLDSRATCFDLLESAFPGGSVTGAPKLRAMEIIEELEPTRRAIYCGSIGYIDINGNMDTNIAIRTLLCHDSNIYCWGGGGVVADSEWQLEYDESLTKIAPLLGNLAGFLQAGSGFQAPAAGGKERTF